MKPLIVITPAYDFPKPEDTVNYNARIQRTYTDAIVKAGGVPVMMSWDEEAGLLDYADGVLFSGGVDLDPAIFGEEKFNDTVSICPLRDRVELALAKQCFERKIPTMGICRGIQTLNVALGGTLWQDIPGQNPDALVHAAGATHDIRVAQGSWLEQMFGTETCTNSYHHQAVKELGAGLRALAWSPDGYIEAFEHESLPLFATQWHPERMTGYMKQDNHPDMAPLFERFVEMCRVYKAEKSLAAV